MVQASPSSQELLLKINVHPLSGSQESVVQGFPSLQTTGVPAQFPLLQASSVVQASPSSQGFPLVGTITPLEHSSQGLKFSFESSIFPSQSLSTPSQTSVAFGLIASLVSSQSSEPINPSPSKSFWESEHPFSSTVSPLGVLSHKSFPLLIPSSSSSRWSDEHPFSSTVSPLGVSPQVSISSVTPSLSESF